jgi:hypothetical protein
MTIDERLENSIQLLDDRHPGDWRRKINVDRLRTCTEHACILGQLFGDYYTGVQKLGCDDRGRYAFHHRPGLSLGEIDDEQRKLDAVWLAYFVSWNVSRPMGRRQCVAA